MNQYIRIKVDNKWVYEHRYKMEQHLGRKIKPFPQELVHHVDDDKHNNDIKNLEVVTNSDHSRHHIMERQSPKIFIKINCSGCNKKFSLQKSQHTWKKNSGQKKFYCSRLCYRLYCNGNRESNYYEIILMEYNAGKTGYRISKDHNILKATVYYHLNKIKEQL